MSVYGVNLIHNRSMKWNVTVETFGRRFHWRNSTLGGCSKGLKLQSRIHKLHGNNNTRSSYAYELHDASKRADHCIANDKSAEPLVSFCSILVRSREWRRLNVHKLLRIEPRYKPCAYGHMAQVDVWRNFKNVFSMQFFVSLLLLSTVCGPCSCLSVASWPMHN